MRMNTLSSFNAARPGNVLADICIVGNGAIAKTAALGFAHAGQSVTLLCPPAPPRPPSVGPYHADDWDARVYALNHTGQRLLSTLKVWDAMDGARVARVDAMQVHGEGNRAGALRFDAFGAHVGELAWIVEDRNLNAALDAALRFAHNVRIVQGRAVGLQQLDDGAVVTLQGGEQLAAQLLVGADGGQSWVRAQCDIGIDFRSYGQRAVVGNFSCERPHHGVAHQWFTADQGIVALLPLPGQRVSLVWSAPEPLAASLLARSKTQLSASVSAWSEAVIGPVQLLSAAGLDQHAPVSQSIKSFPLTLLRTHSLIAPHVALVGDAAHVVHPLAGHGMNLGFADVAQLLQSVVGRELHRGCGDARVLGRYARARSEDVLLMQLTTDSLARLFGAGFDPLRVAANVGMTLLDKIPFLKRQLISHAMGKLR